MQTISKFKLKYVSTAGSSYRTITVISSNRNCLFVSISITVHHTACNGQTRENPVEGWYGRENIRIRGNIEGLLPYCTSTVLVATRFSPPQCILPDYKDKDTVPRNLFSYDIICKIT